MCGIAGVVALRGGQPPTPEMLEAMCATIVHRGPDGQGTCIHEGVGLGARRLAVIDVEGGDQPLANEDGSVQLVFNGEIYNYRELRADLERAGHRFRSHTDGEVVVHLWEDLGVEALQRLNGMFAVALHDRRTGRVLLARDRLGIKPLFYARADDHLVFGSEVKAVLASGLVKRELDVDAARQFLGWEYVPAPATLLRGVRKLGPAELLLIRPGDRGTELRSYWDVPGPGEGRAEGRAVDSDAWAERVATQIDESVQRQLVSDVPLGAFLSGGVDSSLVVSAMGPASTFSIGFDDPSYNELRWAGTVAGHLGASHTTELIRPDVADLFDTLMPFMDDPLGDFSIFPTYLVSKLARADVTVALTGDGGDELFGGYDGYVAEQVARWYARLPGPIRRGAVEPLLGALRPRAEKKGLVNKAKRFVEGFGNDRGLGHARWRLFLDEDLDRALFTPEARAEMSTPRGNHVHELFRRAGARGDLDRGLYVDLKSYLPENCLAKVDRMSMACSLEARVPLLDHELVELAFRVPPELKVRGTQRKLLLKRIAAQRVPREAVYRQKEGFSIPIKHWLGTSLKPLMLDLLGSDALAGQGLLRPAAVRALIDEHLSGRRNHSHPLWSMMVLQDWRRRWRA